MRLAKSWLLLGYLVTFCCAAEIKLGVSNAQQGPSSRLGADLNTGANLYFDLLNDGGGIQGQRVTVLSHDDGYEPVNTVHNTKLLLKKNVIALFNYVGTPTSKSIMELIKRHDTLFVTPFTGADFLREKDNINVFNLRASYEQEAYAQVDYLVKKQGTLSFGILIQADAFGLALEKYYHAALDKYGLKAATTMRYRRNTIDIENAATFIRVRDVDAVLFVGTYAPLTELIKLGAAHGYAPIYSTVSFVSSHTLFSMLTEGQTKKSKVLVTEVVPAPMTCQFNECVEFRRLAEQNNIRQPNHVHFEGYLNAKYLSEAIKQCQSPLQKSCLREQLAKLKLNLFGETKALNPANRQILDTVYFSTLNLPQSP